MDAVQEVDIDSQRVNIYLTLAAMLSPINVEGSREEFRKLLLAGFWNS